MEKTKIKNTSKYPTTLIVKGLNYLGIELTKNLIEQGGYVIIMDELSELAETLTAEIKDQKLLTILDIASITSIEEELRRLDYVYYFEHETKNYLEEISTQEFLQESNYLDTILDLCVKFEAKFLLTTSIKAHQLLIEYKELELTKFDKKFEELPQYTETEIQRYAEKLSLEYNTKMNLDVRIVRIGELLGKGFNPDSEASYIKLIIAAIAGKSLEIEGDGLESDFYIHYLDAVRGIIKAMFSLNTKGKIFSLAIPEEISILSIAYKIMEAEPNAGEIKFTDYNRRLPPLRLYKPATNLVAIGWEYKISIDRGIAQTIEFIKQKEQELFSSKKEIKEEKDTDLEDKTPKQTNANGALSRLIAERKFYNKNRIGSVVLANEQLRQKMTTKEEKNFRAKLSRNLFWIFENIKQQFRFLRNITLREFILYMALFIVFIFIYLLIISPVINLAGRIVSINYNLKNIESNLQSNDYNLAAKNLNTISTNIKEVQERISELNFIFTLTGNAEYYTKIQYALEIQRDYISGLNDSVNSILPIYNYLSICNSKFISRLTDNSLNDSLVDVQSSLDTIDFSKLEKNLSTFQAGMEKLKLTKPQIIDSIDIYPPIISTNLLQSIQNLNSNINYFADLYVNYNFISDLLGKHNKTTYLIILQDNTRYTSGGGTYASYMILTIENGIITQTKINSIDTLNLDTIHLENNELAELNLVSDQIYNTNEVNFADTTYIKDLNIRSTIMKRTFENKLHTTIDIVVWADLKTISEILSIVPIKIKDTNINSDNLLASIDLLSGSNIKDRNKIISEILSTLLIQTCDQDRQLSVLTTFKSLIESKNLSLYTQNMKFKSFVNNYIQKTTSPDFLSFGINNITNTNSDIFPSIEIKGVITVKSDFSTHKNITLKATGLERTLASGWICVPTGSKDFMTPNFDSQYYSRNFSNNEVCQLYLADNIANLFPIEYNTISFENNAQTGYNYIFQLKKPYGINVEYDLEFIFETSRTIIPDSIPDINQINRFAYKNTLTNDLLFRFSTQ
mgnify:CR=1 FL=1